jgi:hypothetical protein
VELRTIAQLLKSFLARLFSIRRHIDALRLLPCRMCGLLLKTNFAFGMDPILTSVVIQFYNASLAMFEIL